MIARQRPLTAPMHNVSSFITFYWWLRLLQMVYCPWGQGTRDQKKRSFYAVSVMTIRAEVNRERNHRCYAGKLVS